MSKLSKAIKITEQLSDEEKKAFAQYFTEEQEDEEDEVEEKKEIKEVKKEETKKEVVKEEVKKEVSQEETTIEKLFKQMNEKIEGLEQKLVKQTAFGAKQKQQSGKESTEFDDLFVKLRSQQRG